ncbi:hypothetical protein GCM10007425_12350 [Lysinibacillus alkalisoli]|uniref:HipA-like kinase domain-containing protein n=1 Tax=Lysinibacillus alkalisoli TaxID=1911548 RepID=A0A917G2I8_9BACI|nr:HipA family kinase [Lysinibacillus alkalisoli]GGG19394.1 hypothetical protein GCM10007425_12350 [Lysinibacillus alkalisoli]
MLQRKKIVNIKKTVMGAGVTKPFLAATEDGGIYVCKIQDDDVSGKLTVLNEYVCYCIGRKIGLPIPDAVFIDLTILTSDDLKRIDRETSSLIGFGSTYLKKVHNKVNSIALDQSVNHAIIPTLYLFDQIILNEDRAYNDGNLLFDFKNKQLIVIDHSHVFKNGLIWTISSLELHKDQLLVNNVDGKYYSLLTMYIKGNSPFQEALEKFALITPDFIESILHEVPLEWNISPEEKLALKDFLCYRLNLIPQILEGLRDYCPRWKGGNST